MCAATEKLLLDCSVPREQAVKRYKGEARTEQPINSFSDKRAGEQKAHTTKQIA